MEFTVTLEGIDELERAWQHAAVPMLQETMAKAIRRGVDKGAEVARSRIHNVTGNLARKTVGRVYESGGEKAEGAIDADAPYASFVEEGTAAHEIRARRADALRWTDGAGVHFARVVHHPGTKSKPFLGPAYLACEQRMMLVIEEGFQRIIAVL